jgi:hypothetical protein
MWALLRSVVTGRLDVLLDIRGRRDEVILQRPGAQDDAVIGDDVALLIATIEALLDAGEDSGELYVGFVDAGQVDFEDELGVSHGVSPLVWVEQNARVGAGNLA